MTVADRVPAASLALPAATFVAGVVGWWLVTAVWSVPAFVLPSPAAVAGRLADSPALYATNAVATLEKVVAGGAVGIGGGGAVAVAVSRSRLVRRAVGPYLVAARVLPKVAVAPLLLIYVGVGAGTATLFVALVSFFPMVVSTTAGLRRLPAEQRELLRSVDAGALRSFLAVELPYARPDVFAGVKQSVTLSVVGATVAEWVVSTEGLGYLILVASENVQPDVMLASLAVLVAIGLSLYGGVVLLQRAVARRLPLE